MGNGTGAAMGAYMAALILSLLGCLVLTLAGRECVRVARLAAVLGTAPGLFLAIWLSAAATSALAAWLGSLLAWPLEGTGGRIVIAIALAVAGIELLLLVPPPVPREPTRSTGAILLVLLAVQLTDGARFVVLAIAGAMNQPLLAGIGGTFGSGAALTLAVIAGARWEARLPWRRAAILVAGASLAAAFLIVLTILKIGH